jgi:hypothetical protein
VHDTGNREKNAKRNGNNIPKSRRAARLMALYDPFPMH